MDKYTKVVYQTEPIGKHKIILYLTTFDMEAYEKEHNSKKIPEKKVAVQIELPSNFEERPIYEIFENYIERYIQETYNNTLIEMKCYIENNLARPIYMVDSYRDRDGTLKLNTVPVIRNHDITIR